MPGRQASVCESDLWCSIFRLDGTARQSQKTSLLNDEQIYRRQIEKRLGDRLILEISRRDVIAALGGIAAAGSGIQANRAQALISAVFSWAVAMELVEAHPGLRIPKFGTETPRERVWKLTRPPSANRITTALRIKGAKVHGLRRTVASEMRRLGVAEETTSPVLAHAKAGITARDYNLHSYDAESWRLAVFGKPS